MIYAKPRHYSKPKLSIQPSSTPKSSDIASSIKAPLKPETKVSPINEPKQVDKSTASPQKNLQSETQKNNISTYNQTNQKNIASVPISLVPTKVESRASSAHKKANLSVSKTINSKVSTSTCNDEMLSDRKTDITTPKQFSQNTFVSGSSYALSNNSNNQSSQYKQSIVGCKSQINNLNNKDNVKINPTEQTKPLTRYSEVPSKYNKHNSLFNSAQFQSGHKPNISLVNPQSISNLNSFSSNACQPKSNNIPAFEPLTSNGQSLPLSIQSVKSISEVKRPENRSIFINLNKSQNSKVLIPNKSMKDMTCSPIKIIPSSNLIKQQSSNAIKVAGSNTPGTCTETPSQYATRPNPYLSASNECNQSKPSQNTLGARSSQFSQNTYSENSTLSSMINFDTVDLNTGVEDLLVHEEKLLDIIEDLSSDPSNSCYELWNFYGISALTGKFENYFKDEYEKCIIKENTVLEFLAMIICYDCQKFNVFAKFEKSFIQIFNSVHQSYLLICDYLLSKLNKSCSSNHWVSKMVHLLNINLRLAPNNKKENIQVIQYHNGNVMSALKLILKDHPGKEPYLDIIFNFLFNPRTVSLLILSDIFRNKVLRFSVSAPFIIF